MKKPMVYGEFKEVMNILERTNVEDNYQDLIKKEEKVLDTLNNVVKYYRDEDIKDGEFINQGIGAIIARFMDVWKDIINEYTSEYNKSYIDIISQGDRLIYIGITMIIVALFLFLIESSNW
jgi:hypothetical protein